jgi:hypothetical protein
VRVILTSCEGEVAEAEATQGDLLRLRGSAGHVTLSLLPW